MTKPMHTADRVMLLMALIPYLKEHGPTTVNDLAVTFHVEPGILRKLVRFLGVAGVPGETLTYQHEDLFDIDWDALEQDDIVHLTQTVAVDDTPRFSSRETVALMAGLQVLQTVLPEPMRSSAERAAEKLARVEPVTDGSAGLSLSAASPDERITLLASAIAQHKQLRFEYRSVSGDVTERTVDPLTLRQRGDRWYLRAHCHDRNDSRTFLVDGIRSPVVLADDAEHDAKDDEPSRFPSELTSVSAHIRVRPHALHLIADFTPQLGDFDDGGWVRGTVELRHAQTAVRLVQAAPGLVVVDGPDAAREAVRLWAEDAAAAYDE